MQTWLSKAEAFPTDGFYVLNYETRSPASWKSGQVRERDVNNLREVKVWMVNPESVKCSCEVWGHELKPAGVWFFFFPAILGASNEKACSNKVQSKQGSKFLQARKRHWSERIENVCQRVTVKDWSGNLNQLSWNDYMIAEAGKIDFFFLSTGVNELEVSENMTNELSKRGYSLTIGILEIEMYWVIDDRVQSRITGVDGWDGVEEQVIGDEEVKDLRGSVLVLHESCWIHTECRQNLEQGAVV